MSVILVIDTIQPQYHLAICQESRELASILGAEDSKTSLEITRQIHKLLAKSEIEKNELTAVLIYTCPVSVTGAQIGQATAEALSLGLGIPLLKIDLLNHIKKSIEPEKHNDSMVLIKITGKYFAWAHLRGLEADDQTQNTKSAEKVSTSQAVEKNAWRQGTIDNFRVEIERLSANKNDENRGENIVNTIYISGQMSPALLTSDTYKQLVITRLIMKFSF